MNDADLHHDQPPRRQDARRNFDRLVAAAREVFEAEGAGASLDLIARKAGVGNATLYRHFPTRHALLLAVCTSEVEHLCMLGEKLVATRAPLEALESWLRQFVTQVRTRRGLAQALMALERETATATFASCQERIGAVGSRLVANAIKAGAVAAKTRFDDLFALANAIAVATESGTSQQAERMLEILLRGLRATAAGRVTKA